MAERAFKENDAREVIDIVLADGLGAFGVVSCKGGSGNATTVRVKVAVVLKRCAL